MAADERRSASRYNTIAVMCKHRIAGEVGLMINSKKMVFQHSPCFYSSPKDRAGLVSIGARDHVSKCLSCFSVPVPRQKQRNPFGSCSKGQKCFTNMIKQCVCLDFAPFPTKKHLAPNTIKSVLIDNRSYFRTWPGNCSPQVLQSESGL